MKCKYFGKVRNKEGKIIDSRLYKGLLSITSKEVADKIYKKTLSDKFITEMLPSFQKDQYGEPTLFSMLLASKELREAVNLDKVAIALTKEFGLTRSQDKDKLLSLKANFDKVNPFKGVLFLNLREHRSSDIPTYWTASISGRDSLTPIQTAFIDRIKSVLSEAGFSIGALTDYEKRLGVKGAFDTEAVANSLKEVIRIAEGEEGLKALPEEFAHLVIEGLSSNPSIERLLRYMGTPGIVEAILGDDYQQYKALYKSEDKLQREAAAKLLAEGLERIALPKSEESILKKLLRLVKNTLNKIFSNITPRTIDSILAESRGLATSIGREALSGKYTEQLKKGIVSKRGVYYELDQRVAKERELLKRLMRAAQVKLRVMENRGSSTGQQIQSKLLQNLSIYYRKGQTLEGITKYMTDVSTHSNKIVEMVDSMDPNASIQDKARFLSNILSYTSSYISSLEDIKTTLLELKEDFKDLRGNEILYLVDSLMKELQYSNVRIQKIMKETFSQFLTEVYGKDTVEINMGSRKGTYRIVDLLEEIPIDVGSIDMWANGIAESTDLVSKIMDLAIRNRESQAYSNVLDIEKELLAATKKLKEAGYSDTEFMYEKDENGIPTGRLLLPYDMEAYSKAYREEVERLRNSPSFRKDLAVWEANHPVTSFVNSEYSRLSEAQKEYYETYMRLKKEIEAKLPKGKRDLYRAVNVRKDFIERLSSSGSISEAWAQIKSGAADLVKRRVDDGESAFSKGYLNLQGEVVKTIPLLYIATLEDPRALSLDSASALLAYAASVEKYVQLKPLEDIINIGDAVLKRRKVGITRSGKKVKAVFDKVKGVDLDTDVIKEGVNSNAYKVWRHLIDTRVYGETSNMSDQLQTSGTSPMKVASLVNKISTIMDMGFNVMLGVANIGTGIIFENTEAVAGEYFNAKELASSDTEFFKELPSIVAELPSRIKTSKIGLFTEKVDIDQQSLSEFRDKGIGKGAISRLFSMKTLLFMLGAGDFWIRTRAAIAMAKHTKLYLDGQETNLWEALERVPIHPEDPSLGYNLVLKEGLVDENGNPFTEKEFFNFKNKVTRVGHKIIGMANPQDLNMARKTVIGKLAFLYRTWMPAAYNRRFQRSTKDILLDEDSEGYYITGGRVLWAILKNSAAELRAGRLALITGNLTEAEKTNIKRAATEMLQLALIMISYMALSGAWEDEEKTKWQYFILYELRRLQTEVGAVTPSPYIASEMKNIFKSPVAASRAMERTLNLFQLLIPSNYTETIQSGKYEGRSRAFKYFMESPATAMTNTVIRQFYPEEALKFYDTK